VTTVALIGADGAGKTTVANCLVKKFPGKIKYLYMGSNFESSNVALPTSRLIQFVRNKLRKSDSKNSGIMKSLNKHIQQQDNWWVEDNRGKIFAFFRLFNRIAEEWYRQFVSWNLERQGFMVIYDRHVIYEKLRDQIIETNKKKRFSERLHSWYLKKIYPKPDYIIFLDAPAEVLFKRKGETSIEFIEKTRKKYFEIGKSLNNFKIINVDQSLDNICNDIGALLINSNPPNI
jgi:thymidylate kinase